ncbi:MAG: SDR family oxidoreductase [Acidimicrobiales bacterium]|jgi:NAD(P)-dependent dehydrogenase (short-subunit alcohol dehydrogenase family)|nr:SDR family oxidoreductase [Acidimicrobiales bacterium]
MADIGFDNRVAIVTGAGGGLGRCHALELARRGARLVINDLGGAVDGSGSDATPAQKVVQEIEALGGEAVANGDSVGTPEGGAAIVQAALDAFGRIDIVVNNAGILRDKTFHKMEQSDIDSVIDVHLRGAFHVTRPAWTHMREQGYGRVVMTSSNAGILGNFGQTNYGAAKMGLVGLTNVLALEGAKYNIKVNAIAPVARTRMTEDILGPLAEKLNPEQISPVVAWLASEDCPVSGEVYSCGGGTVARFFVGLTKGIFEPGLTVETIRDRWDEIRDQTGYDDFPDNGGEIKKLARLLRV